MLLLTEDNCVVSGYQALLGEGVLCCVLTARDLSTDIKIDEFNSVAKDVLKPRMVGVDPKYLKNIMELTCEKYLTGLSNDEYKGTAAKNKMSLSDKMQIAKMAIELIGAHGDRPGQPTFEGACREIELFVTGK
jgi:hypothetical protein